MNYTEKTFSYFISSNDKSTGSLANDVIIELSGFPPNKRFLVEVNSFIINEQSMDLTTFKGSINLVCDGLLSNSYGSTNNANKYLAQMVNDTGIMLLGKPVFVIDNPNYKNVRFQLFDHLNAQIGDAIFDHNSETTVWSVMLNCQPIE